MAKIVKNVNFYFLLQEEMDAKSVCVNLAKVMQCETCKDTLFRVGEKPPKVFPCGHTFCVTCCKEFMERAVNESFSCPKCRRRCRAELAENYALNVSALYTVV